MLLQHHHQHQQPPAPSASSATSVSPSSNFNFNLRNSEGPRSADSETSNFNPGFASYQFPSASQMETTPGAGSLDSRYHSPDQAISRLHLRSHVTPLHESRRPSSGASSQGSTSVSSVKRAFNNMQTGSASLYSHEDDTEQRSGPPTKRTAAGLGLLRPRNVGGEEWEWLPSGAVGSNIGGGLNENGLRSSSDTCGMSARSSISPTTSLKGHARQSSFPLDHRHGFSSQGQSQVQGKGQMQIPPSQSYNAAQQSNPRMVSTPNPYRFPQEMVHGGQQHYLGHQSNGTPNLAKPYNDYDIHSRPQPDRLAYYQIAAGQDRRILGSQPAPPLTEWEIANSRRGSFATGVQTPIPVYVFSGLGQATPQGNYHSNSIYTPLVAAPQSSPVDHFSGFQFGNRGSGSFPSQHFHPNHSHPHANYHPQSQPHPLSRRTSPSTPSRSHDQLKQSQIDPPTFPQGYYDNAAFSPQKNRSRMDPNSSKRKAEMMGGERIELSPGSEERFNEEKGDEMTKRSRRGQHVSNLG